MTDYFTDTIQAYELLQILILISSWSAFCFYDFSCFLTGAFVCASLLWRQNAWKGCQPHRWNRTRRGDIILPWVIWCCSVSCCTGCFCSFPTLQSLIRFAFCSILLSSKVFNLVILIFLHHTEYQCISLNWNSLNFEN